MAWNEYHLSGILHNLAGLISWVLLLVRTATVLVAVGVVSSLEAAVLQPGHRVRAGVHVTRCGSHQYRIESEF